MTLEKNEEQQRNAGGSLSGVVRLTDGLEPVLNDFVDIASGLDEEFILCDTRWHA